LRKYIGLNWIRLLGQYLRMNRIKSTTITGCNMLNVNNKIKNYILKLSRSVDNIEYITIIQYIFKIYIGLGCAMSHDIKLMHLWVCIIYSFILTFIVYDYLWSWISRKRLSKVLKFSINFSKNWVQKYLLSDHPILLILI